MYSQKGVTVRNALNQKLQCKYLHVIKAPSIKMINVAATSIMTAEGKKKAKTKITSYASQCIKLVTCVFWYR